MADPKYAGLPGIALDQPDMFETSGTGDDEAEEEEGSGGEVEEPAPVLHLSSLSWLGDLEIGSGGETEGLVQRYTRLRCEVAELAEELDAMTESAREGQVAGLSLQVITKLSPQYMQCKTKFENLNVRCPTLVKGLPGARLLRRLGAQLMVVKEPSRLRKG